MEIIVIDDDRLAAVSLKTILESTGGITVQALGGSGAEAVSLYRAHQPDVMLMDIRMEGMTGIEAGREILREFPDARILYLTTFSDDEYIVKALKLGVKGYLLKQDYKSLPAALHAAINGQSVFGGAVIDKLPTLMSKPNTTDDSFDYRKYDISEKEYEVIQLVAEGFSNKEISQKLFLSEGTVRNYLSTILEKLNLRDRTQLAIFYLKHE